MKNKIISMIVPLLLLAGCGQVEVPASTEKAITDESMVIETKNVQETTVDTNVEISSAIDENLESETEESNKTVMDEAEDESLEDFVLQAIEIIKSDDEEKIMDFFDVELFYYENKKADNIKPKEITHDDVAKFISEQEKNDYNMWIIESETDYAVRSICQLDDESIELRKQKSPLTKETYDAFNIEKVYEVEFEKILTDEDYSSDPNVCQPVPKVSTMYVFQIDGKYKADFSFTLADFLSTSDSIISEN